MNEYIYLEVLHYIIRTEFINEHFKIMQENLNEWIVTL
jgi:hypothetical protein